MMKRIKLAGLQIGTLAKDADKHKQKILTIIEEIMINKQPHLIVLPHDLTYTQASTPWYKNHKASIFLERLAELSTAFNCHIIGSFYNNKTASVFSPIKGLIHYQPNQDNDSNNRWCMFELDNKLYVTTLLGDDFCDPKIRSSLPQTNSELIIIQNVRRWHENLF